MATALVACAEELECAADDAGERRRRRAESAALDALATE